MTIKFVTAEDLTRLVPMAAAVDALESAFSEDVPPGPLRTHLEAGDGTLLVMPAAGAQGSGVKLVTVVPGNPERGLPLIQGIYVFFSPETMAPVAAIDGAALTALRTSAVSGLATRHLANPDAHKLVIFGAGTQGNAHLDAMATVRPIEWVRIVSRSAGPAEKLAARARDMGFDAALASPQCVAEADLVCTCTTSRTQLFEGSMLAGGVHVNAVGAFEPDARELDDKVIGRATVVVETREAALAEAGDVMMPLRSGALDESRLFELGEVVRGRRVRGGPDDVTVFKSVGVAFEDLAVAAAAVGRL